MVESLPVELAHRLYTNPDTLNSLDSILATLGVSHLEFRTYVKDNNLGPLPDPSEGLLEELCMLDWPEGKKRAKYYIKSSDLAPTSRGLTIAQKTEIRDRRRNGESVDVIAVAFDVSRGRIYQLTQNVVNATRKSRQSAKMNDKLNMAKMRRDGYSVQEIADKYELTTNTVYVYLRDIGGML